MPEALPKCHPIDFQGYHFEGGCVTGFIRFLLGKGVPTIRRSEDTVYWLARTETPGVFQCPVRVMGRCDVVFPCIPEPEGIRVIDEELQTSIDRLKG